MKQITFSSIRLNMITITISLLTQNHNRDNNGPCSQIFLGESVLVHCLAGAHRAGTTGIISLMHFQACLFVFKNISKNMKIN